MGKFLSAKNIYQFMNDFFSEGINSYLYSKLDYISIGR